VLAGVFLGNALLAELIGGKLFQVPTPWHVFTLSCGIVLWPVVFIFTDIVNEYFGRRGVRQLSFLAAAIIAYAYLALALTRFVPAASFSPVDDASFSRVFFQSQWIIVGSIAAFLLAQLLDVSVFWLIRRHTGHRFLWLRATGSTVVSQLIDTFVVQFVGLHLPHRLGQQGIDFPTFVNSASSGYLFKVAVALAITPLLYLVHGVIDRYLGESAAEQIVEKVATAEHADDATVLHD
jgi:queuosine precursor transporter